MFPSVTERVKEVFPKNVELLAVTFMILVKLFTITEKFCNTVWLKVKLCPFLSKTKIERLINTCWPCNRIIGPIVALNTGGSLNDTLIKKLLGLSPVSPPGSVTVYFIVRNPVKSITGVKLMKVKFCASTVILKAAAKSV